MISRSVPHRPIRSGRASRSPAAADGAARVSRATSPGARTTRAGAAGAGATGAGAAAPDAGAVRAAGEVMAGSSLLAVWGGGSAGRLRKVCVGGAAEQAGHLVGAGAHGLAQFLDAPGRQVALDAGDAERARAAAVVTEERGAGAEDALGILLVVEGEPVPPDQGEVVEERADVGDGARGPRPHAGLGADGPDAGGVEGCQDGLAGGGGVGHLTLAERGMEADAARAVHPVGEDRVALVADGYPGGHAGQGGEFRQDRAAHLAERKLLAGDVAQAQQRRAEGVPGAGADLAQVAERGQGPGDGERGALG